MSPDVELWLYGSRARGDADTLSDTDILAIASWRANVEGTVKRLNLRRVNVSSYTWDEIEAMRDYGSLFLHHLDE